MLPIVDKFLGIAVSVSHLIAHHPGVFFSSFLGLPIAHAFNLFWVKDIFNGFKTVFTSIHRQTINLATTFTNSYASMGEAIKTFITNGIGGFVNVLLIPVNVTIQCISLVLTGISNILNSFSGLLTRFYNAIGKLVNRFLDFLRSFFGDKGPRGGDPGGGPGGDPGGGPGGGFASFGNNLDAYPDPNDTILAINPNGAPGVRMGTDAIRRMFESAPGELPGHILVSADSDVVANSSTDAIAAATSMMEVTTVVADVVVPAAGTVCAIIALSILLAPIAPYMGADLNIA